MPRPTGLQRQVFSFYRNVLRVCREQQDTVQASRIQARARQELERYRQADRKDYQRVEYLLRRGKRQLDLASTGHAKLTNVLMS
ncbi:hypothetical protein WJX73_009596 [Symbiochloris irregularis]|uniref:Complex 1 LYR protein domain-containing protein n=1 Tax=Symbiochloris irregularis TaxID=706552 RepID=A0AAW1P316_9CHLO